MFTLIDFARGLYSIGALNIPKKRSKEENMVSGPRLFYFGKIKRLRLEIGGSGNR